MTCFQYSAPVNNVNGVSKILKTIKYNAVQLNTTANCNLKNKREFMWYLCDSMNKTEYDHICKERIYGRAVVLN